MSNTSRRRIALAAGAVLAGAAIPVAAAGTAWADQISDGNAAPAVPVSAAGPASVEVPSVTPTGAAVTEITTLTSYPGLTATQVQEIDTAVGDHIPVEVSVEGKVVLDVNQEKGTANEAIATSSAKSDDTAVSIGGGSDSNANGAGAVAFADGANSKDNLDKASAIGTDANASITDSTSTTATADGSEAHATVTDSSGSKAIATRTDAAAEVTDSSKSTATASLYGGAEITDSSASTAKASEDAAANVSNSNESKATATGPQASAEVSYSTASTATATNKLTATEVALAAVGDGSGSHAIATGAGSSAEISGAGLENDGIGAATVGDSTAKATNGGFAEVENNGTPAGVTATHDTATAINPGSGATIVDSDGSSLTVTDGERYEIVDQSDKHQTNVVPAEVTTFADVRAEPSLP